MATLRLILHGRERRDAVTRTFDLVVLATGQRPPAGTESLAEMTGIELNQWGFCKVKDFSPGATRETVSLERILLRL